MKYTTSQQAKILDEALSPKVTLQCDRHPYQLAPYGQCPNCNMARLVQEFADIPPHLRQERLDQLEQAMYHMAEKIEQGKWDVSIYEHPEIEIEKDAE